MKMTANRIRALLLTVFPDSQFIDDFLFLTPLLAIAFPEHTSDSLTVCPTEFDVDNLSFQIDANEFSNVNLAHLLSALEAYQRVNR